MDRELEELVWRRAQSRCESCQLAQAFDGAKFEIDHITARKHYGKTTSSNLCLACFPCNNHKGPNIAGVDPLTKKVVKLFDPHRHRWQRHFRWDGAHLVGITAIVRATIDVLEINHADRVQLRQALIDEGVFPPANA